MQSLVKSVEQQIQQLDHPELKQWLLGHLNLNACCLTELFCKQYAADGITTRAPHALSTNPIFSMVYTFGPQALIDELHTLFSSLPSITFNSFKHELSGQCSLLLQDYIEAWPVLKQIQQQPHQIIAWMDQAKPGELEAFMRLNPDSDWALLTEVFLIKNNQEVTLANRLKLINLGMHLTPQSIKISVF